MGLLTRIWRRQGFRVVVLGLGEFPPETFRRFWEAREYADYLAATNPDAVCLIFEEPRTDPVYRTDGTDSEGPPGSAGVREPRRPVPGSSAGAIALDQPD